MKSFTICHRMPALLARRVGVGLGLAATLVHATVVLLARRVCVPAAAMTRQSRSAGPTIGPSPNAYRLSPPAPAWLARRVGVGLGLAVTLVYAPEAPAQQLRFLEGHSGP